MHNGVSPTSTPKDFSNAYTFVFVFFWKIDFQIYKYTGICWNNVSRQYMPIFIESGPRTFKEQNRTELNFISTTNIWPYADGIVRNENIYEYIE